MSKTHRSLQHAPRPPTRVLFLALAIVFVAALLTADTASANHAGSTADASLDRDSFILGGAPRQFNITVKPGTVGGADAPVRQVDFTPPTSGGTKCDVDSSFVQPPTGWLNNSDPPTGTIPESQNAARWSFVVDPLTNPGGSLPAAGLVFKLGLAACNMATDADTAWGVTTYVTNTSSPPADSFVVPAASSPKVAVRNLVVTAPPITVSGPTGYILTPTSFYADAPTAGPVSLSITVQVPATGSKNLSSVTLVAPSGGSGYTFSTADGAPTGWTVSANQNQITWTATAPASYFVPGAAATMFTARVSQAPATQDSAPSDAFSFTYAWAFKPAASSDWTTTGNAGANPLTRKVLEVTSFTITDPSSCSSSCKATADQDNLGYRVTVKSHATSDIAVTGAVTSSGGLDSITAVGSATQTISAAQSKNYDFDVDYSASTSDRTMGASATATGASVSATSISVDIQTAPTIAGPASGRTVIVTSADTFVSSGTGSTNTLDVRVNLRNTGEATASTLALDLAATKVLLDGIDDAAHNKRTSFTLDSGSCASTVAGGASATCTLRVVLDSNHVPDQGAYTFVVPITARDSNKAAGDTSGAISATLTETNTVLAVDNTAPIISPPVITPHPRGGEVDLRVSGTDRYFINASVTDAEGNLAGNPFVEITGPLPATTVFTTLAMAPNGTANSFSGTFSLGSTFGTFRYQVKAQDKAANVRANPSTASSTFVDDGTTHTFQFKDTTAPTQSAVTVTQVGVASGTAFQAGKTLTFSVDANDNFKITPGNGVKLVITGPGAPCASAEKFMSLQGNSANGLGTYTTEFLCTKEGAFTFRVTVTDQAGNGVTTDPARTFSLEDTSGPNVASAFIFGRGDASTAITNPGFESALTGWTTSTGTGTYTADTTIMKRGATSAKGVETTETSLGRLTQDVTSKLAIGAPYNLSGWIKTAGVSGSGGFSIELLYVDSTGATVANGVVSKVGPVTSTTEWTYYQTSAFVLPSVPTGATKLVIALDFEDSKGTAWADDVAVFPAGGRFHVKGDSDVSLAFNVTVSDPIGVDKTKVFLQFINASDSSVHERPMAFDKELFDASGLMNFTNVTNFAGFQELNYTIRVRATDTAGRESLVDFNSDETTIVFDRTLPTVSVITVTDPATFTKNCVEATLSLAEANCRATAKVTASDARPFSVQINYTATLPDGTVFKGASAAQKGAAAESKEFTFTDIVLIHNAQYALQAHVEDLAGNVRLSNTRDIIVGAYAPVFKEKFLSKTHSSASVQTIDVVIFNKSTLTTPDEFDLSVTTTNGGVNMPNRQTGGTTTSQWTNGGSQLFDAAGSPLTSPNFRTASVAAGSSILVKFKASIPSGARVGDFVTFNLVAASKNQPFHSHNMTILVGLHSNRLELYPDGPCKIGTTTLASLCRETDWLSESRQQGLNETVGVSLLPGEAKTVNFTLVNLGTLNDTISLDKNPISVFNTTTNAWTVSFSSNHSSFVSGTPARVTLRPLEVANVTVTIGAPGNQVNGAGATITLNATSNATTPAYNLTNISATLKFNSLTFSSLQFIKSASAYDGQNALTLDFIADLGTSGVFIDTKVNVTGPGVTASYVMTRSGGGAKTTGTYVATVPAWTGVGFFQWQIYASNSLGESDVSTPPRNFTILESPNQKPVITGATASGTTLGANIVANVSYSAAAFIPLTASVSDNFYVNAVFIDVFKGAERKVNASASAPAAAKQAGAWTYSFQMPAASSEAFGNYTFNVTAFDANNNSATLGPFNFTIGDFAGPDIATPRLSTTAANASGTPQVEVGTPLTFTVLVTDNAGIENIDTVFVNVSFPNATSTLYAMNRTSTNATDKNWSATASFTASGVHTYSILATDKAGRSNLLGFFAFVVGTSLAPQIQVVSPALSVGATSWKTGDDGKRWTNLTATIEANALDSSIAASGVTMKVNGAVVGATKAATAGGVNARYTATFADGDTVTVEVVAVDTTNAQSNVSFQFKVDGSAPEAPVESFDGASDIAGEPSIAISPTTGITLSTPTDAGSGVKGVHWRATLGGASAGAFNAYADAFTVGASGQDGVYLIEFYAVDHAGNRGATTNVSVMVDATPPTVSHLPTGRVVNVTAEDALTGIDEVVASYILNATGLPKTLALTKVAGSDSYTGEFTDLLVNGASVSYTIRATDGVGNVKALQNGTQPFLIGGTAKAPTVRIVTPKNGATVNETGDIAWTAQHESGQSVKVDVTYEKQGQSPVAIASNRSGDGSVTWEVDQLTDGVYLIRVTGTLGQLSSSVVHTVTLKKAGVVGSVNVPQTAVRQGSVIPITAPVFSPAKPVASVEAVIKVAGKVVATVPMRDDGLLGDQKAGDGLYSATYTPGSAGGYTVDVVVNYNDGSKDTAANAASFTVKGAGLIPDEFIGGVTTLGVIALMAVALGGYAAFVRWKQ
ncbi:MAG: hypothetical protein HY556_06590 [Euryarchaeota archaeon]|nr:hypothetical protein [Euryarchaeota archaeon]